MKAKLKKIINAISIRLFGKIFQKNVYHKRTGWKTTDRVANDNSRTYFGYRFGKPVKNFPLTKKWWANPVFHQKKNNETETRPLLVVGEGWTGASAVTGYLCEFRWVLQFGSEFRLVKDPGGIIDLELSLLDHWTHWNASSAIRRFVQLAELHARDNRYRFFDEYQQTGFSSDKFCNGKFMKLVEQYIDDLAYLRFPGNWFMDDCGKPTLSVFFDNIKRRLGNSNEEFFVIHPERDKFIKATHEFLNAVIKEFSLWVSHHDSLYFDDSNINWLIFDQAIWPRYAEKTGNYFENAKTIIVDRDPRDVFLSVSLSKSDSPVRKHRSYFPEDPESFAKHYKKLRENSRVEEGPSLLRISFEDFNLHHEETSARVRKFLNLDASDHLIPNTFYKNEVSSSRVGKWQNCSDEVAEAIKTISDIIPEHCYPLPADD